MTSEPMKRTDMSRCRDSRGGYDDKALNKCATAARKYFLMSLLQIPTGDDADADLGEDDGATSRERLALPARRGCPELQREPTLKLGNSPILQYPF
jgi:ERF superfamily